MALSRRASVAEHWALFVEGTKVKWHFGNPSSEFIEVVSNFLMGLGKLGKELFGTEGIASIIFDRRGHAGLKASEIFIVSLEEKFFLIISDPSVTLLLIAAEGGIPEDIQIIMKAVLVGQASILYSNMVAEVDDDDITITYAKLPKRQRKCCPLMKDFPLLLILMDLIFLLHIISLIKEFGLDSLLPLLALFIRYLSPNLDTYLLERQKFSNYVLYLAKTISWL